MSIERSTWRIAILILAFSITGCAVRPRPPIPVGLTAEQALEVLSARQAAVHDYSARARTTFIENGVPNDATLVVRYLAPGRCRVYVNGPMGINMARFSVLSDSLTVWVPLENYYFTLPRTNEYVIALAPGVEIGFDMFERLFTTSVPDPDEQAGCEVSLDHTDDGNVVLIYAWGNIMHRLVLTSAELLVTAEEYLVDGAPVWQKTIDSYTTVDGIPFPSSVTVTAGQMKVELSFSNIELNVGYTEESLRFSIPSSVERYTGGIPH